MLARETISLSAKVAHHLPYLRRYARALTGNQTTGDTCAAAVLEAVVADPVLVQDHTDAKIALFSIFHSIWSSSGAPVDEADGRMSSAAQARLASLTRNSREVLLLHTIEGFTLDQIGPIMATDPDEAGNSIAIALREMEATMRGAVLVIEDEAIIAMDIAAIVEGMGHRVSGIAHSHAAAVENADAARPDLILADIQLAQGSSGIDAVNEILARLGDVPVIFITAFPELLLTGERPEPAFLINKPYTEEQVRSTVSQALFFASTEPLKS